MAVTLLSKNYNTNYCEFSFDDWESDKNSLPTLNVRGKGVLSTIYSCCQGSKAIGTDGNVYILTGDNTWIKYSENSSGESSSSNPDIEPITKDEIQSLFSNSTGSIPGDDIGSITTDEIKSLFSNSTDNNHEDEIEVITEDEIKSLFFKS